MNLIICTINLYSLASFVGWNKRERAMGVNYWEISWQQDKFNYIGINSIHILNNRYKVHGWIPTIQYKWSIFGFLFFWNKSTNQIFKDQTRESGFASLQIWIHKDLGFVNLDLGFVLCSSTKDSWGFVGFVKTGWIFWKLTGFVINNWNQIFSNPDLWSPKQYKSTGTWLLDTIPAT